MLSFAHLYSSFLPRNFIYKPPIISIFKSNKIYSNTSIEYLVNHIYYL